MLIRDLISSYPPCATVSSMFVIHCNNRLTMLAFVTLIDARVIVEFVNNIRDVLLLQNLIREMS